MRTKAPEADDKPRYEFKYVVPSATAHAFREALSDTIEFDPNARDQQGYHVTSLYYDTPDHAAFFEKLDGVDPRCKVRVRYYGSADNLETTAAFAEAKHRRDQLVSKTRVRIPGSALERMTGEQPFGPEHLVDVLDTSPQKAALLSIALRRPIFPQCVVSYFREPFVCRLDPTLRITFDYQLRAADPGAFVGGERAGQLFLPEDKCVVELKFHWSMPLWLVSACREHGMPLGRYSKYCEGLVGLARLGSPELAECQLS
jgi:hypothetical protein